MNSGKLGMLGKNSRKLLYSGLSALVLGLSSCAGAEKSMGPDQPPSNPPPQQSQNHPPVISSSPLTQADENSLYVYRIDATDPDGDPLAYAILEGPSWLSVSSNTVYGNVPEVLADSTFPVRIKAYDSRSSTEQSYNLNVKNLLNIHSLTQSQLSGLQVAEKDMVFSQPVEFAKGDVISSGINPETPNGLLRKTDSLSSDRRTIYTSQAVLEDVVRQASVSYHQDLSPSAAGSFSGLRGVSMAPSGTRDLAFRINLNNVVLYDRDGDSTTTGDRVLANGTIDFSAGFDFDLSVSGFRLEKMLVQETLNESADITLSSDLLGFTNLYQIKLAEYKFPPIVVAVLPTFPPIPLILRPRIDVTAGINASRVNPLSFRVRQDATLKGGLEYNNGWHPIADLSSNFDFALFNPSGDWDVTAYAGPTLKLPLFDVAGANIGTAANITLQSANENWKLWGGFNASAGVSAEIFSHVIASYSVPILQYKKLLAARDSQPQPSDSTFIDPRDGQSYRFTKIGNQVWMAQNLNFNSLGSEYYQNNLSNSAIYGRLYDWNSSSSSCPANWHLPTEQEWGTLFNYIGTFTGGGKLKATGTIEQGTGRWHSPNAGATDATHFSGLPGGKKEDGTYSREGYQAYFWAATPYALAYSLDYDLATAGSYLGAANPVGFSFSVRCLKN